MNVLIETLDPLTGDIEHTGTLAEYREANAEDAEVLEALDKLEREGGDVAVGHEVLRRGELECDDVCARVRAEVRAWDRPHSDSTTCATCGSLIEKARS